MGKTCQYDSRHSHGRPIERTSQPQADHRVATQPIRQPRHVISVHQLYPPTIHKHEELLRCSFTLSNVMVYSDVFMVSA
ncbi:hypothetical protein KIN20_023760 [Parelaphostrongylus tenuis]|uniref:Uncharacterized protein n=1 Tax=Parelaphostrongylus tenuis TaxID=148309 RepID=A0AAD5MSE4_PARTN|nr:hypothetical protein KIN20_023760 [Parelaphostrongylus tenuis]